MLSGRFPRQETLVVLSVLALAALVIGALLALRAARVPEPAAAPPDTVRAERPRGGTPPYLDPPRPLDSLIADSLILD